MVFKMMRALQRYGQSFADLSRDLGCGFATSYVSNEIAGRLKFRSLENTAHRRDSLVLQVLEREFGSLLEKMDGITPPPIRRNRL